MPNLNDKGSNSNNANLFYNSAEQVRNVYNLLTKDVIFTSICKQFCLM